METDSSQNLSTNILPIPPALEFPFSGDATKSTNTLTLPTGAQHDSDTPMSTLIEGVTLEAQQNKDSTTHEKAKKPISRPMLSQRKFLTERPKPTQQRSRLGIKRRQTGKVYNALNDAAWQSDVDSESSSSEDEKLSESSKMKPEKNEKVSRGKHVDDTEHIANSRRRDARGPQFSKFCVGNEGFQTKGKVSKTSGRLDISVNETSNRGYLAKALGTALQHHLKPDDIPENDQTSAALSQPREDLVRRPDIGARLSTVGAVKQVAETSIPPMNIVIMVIGSRGDIQPFLKIGKILKEQHGHRVRMATHPAFRDFVEQDIGLEFFSVGGDPAELMAFMVKNPGLIPTASTIRAGEIGRKRDSMFEMFQGFWRACINATDDESDASNLKMMGDKHPFVADAIIANPPSFAHIHCAERLGIPLHLMFTFPYSPTQKFPHPLANIKATNVDTNYTNFISYPLVEMMTWQGLGDLVNRFRVDTLGLEPVSTLWAPGQLFRLKVPYTYLWSPELIPKPADWGPEIEIGGFVFLDLASSFKPPESLSKFLDAGEPPVYIGFGSIVLDDPDKFTSLIFEAVAKAGVRALVSKGWGGLGDEENTPENIYMLDNTPHDWLFPRVSAVVHHGGAGTTAIGLKCGKPTMIVPFFGDQPFWGAMVAKAGAGARDPIPYKKLTVEKLAEGLKQCLLPESRAAAERLAQGIAIEGDGAQNAVNSFHRHLPMKGEHSMRCSVLQDHVAVWEVKKKSALRLSALAAEILMEKKKIKIQELRLIRHHDWNDFEGPGEPITGGGAALLNSVGGIVKGVGSVPVKWAKSFKKRELRSQRRNNFGIAETDTEVDESDKQPTPKNQASLDHTAPNNLHERYSTSKTQLQNTNDATKDDENSILEKDSHLTNGGSPRHINSRLQGNDNDEEEAIHCDETQSLDENLAQDLARHTGVGFAKSGEALVKVPMDLALAIAQGFHNAPRLYGDSTVRTTTRISGIHSGLRAAGEEFLFGIYDGVTGLVLQPYNGAKRNGALGFVLGVGKGFGGFILKDLAALIGPVGYTLKGMHKELIKGRQPTAFIRQARHIQGRQDIRALSAEERLADEEKMDAAWTLISEIWNEVTKTKQEGIRSRIAIARERRRLEREGAFESIETTKHAFQKWKSKKARQETLAAENMQFKKLKNGSSKVFQPADGGVLVSGHVGKGKTAARAVRDK